MTSAKTVVFVGYLGNNGYALVEFDKSDAQIRVLKNLTGEEEYTSTKGLVRLLELFVLLADVAMVILLVVVVRFL